MPTFGELEAAIMDRVWTVAAPVTVRQVLERLDRDPEPAYTTVQTVMDVLWRKGWLTRSKQGRTNVYAATATREDYISGLMGEALAQTQDRAAALLHFFQGIEPEDAIALRRLLAAARRRLPSPPHLHPWVSGLATTKHSSGLGEH